MIQIEPAGGSPARNVGPFYEDDPSPEHSLFWWSYAANKRGITLNLETTDGQALLKQMVKGADFLIESFQPGYMHQLDLYYETLKTINPGLVMVSITPFGQDGPYAQYKGADLIGMALGGLMYLTGDSDRPPLRVSAPQFYLHGSAAGATAAMLAHTHRAATGEGQYVDVSCQQAAAKTLAHAPQFWDLEGVILKRMGAYRQSAGETATRVTWPCKDGYVNYMPSGGVSGAGSVRALLTWMAEEGMKNEELERVNWEDMGYGTARGEIMQLTIGPFEAFFATHTVDELSSGSLERRILLFPVATPRSILNHPQLKAREYFQELHHPDLDRSFTYPGLFVKDREGQRLGLRRRAPLIGEHNQEIYRDELGFTDGELRVMKEGGVI